MARRARNLLPDSYYHITQKCNHDAFSFEDAPSCSRYLELLQEVFAKYAVPLLAYCLMLNHIHLLVKTGADPRLLSCAMRELSGRLAAEHNRRHGVRGHFWADRFHSTFVAAGGHFRNVLAYIDANPLNTRDMKDPAEWRFCSYYELQAAAVAEAEGAPDGGGAPEAPRGRPALSMGDVLEGGRFDSREEFLSWQRARLARERGDALVDAALADRRYAGHFALGGPDELLWLQIRLEGRGVHSYMTFLRGQEGDSPALWALDLCGPAYALRKAWRNHFARHGVPEEAMGKLRIPRKARRAAAAM